MKKDYLGLRLDTIRGLIKHGRDPTDPSFTELANAYLSLYEEKYDSKLPLETQNRETKLDLCVEVTY